MPHKFGINSPLSVKHISQKAFFKHALGLMEEVHHKLPLTEKVTGRKPNKDGITCLCIIS